MATFKDLQDRIALDYLNRFDLIGESKRAIKNSIKQYEAQRFWFNEAQTATVATATVAALGVPSDFLRVDRLELSVNGQWLRLCEESFDNIRIMNATSATGMPSYFAYRQDAFQLAVIPASAYPVTCYYVKSLPELSADTDTNAWTNDAQNLIVHCAVLDLMMGTISIGRADPQRITYHKDMLQQGMDELQSRNLMRLCKRIKPTQF